MNKPTKKQLEAELAELKAQLDSMRTKSSEDGVIAGEVSSFESLARESTLTSKQRQLEVENAPTRTYAVTLLLATNVGATVTDPRGHKKDVHWEKRGEVQLLTADQIKEIQDHRDMFYDGILAAPELFPPSPNFVGDYDRFIERSNPDTVHTRIAQIDSTPVLFDFYHFIENKRLSKNGEIVPLSPKQQLVAMAIMNRLNALVGFNFTATDVE